MIRDGEARHEVIDQEEEQGMKYGMEATRGGDIQNADK